MTIKNSIALVFIVIFINACSMLPYNSEFQCEKGKGNGVCGSVSEVYQMSFDMDNLRNKKLEIHKNTCENCDDKSFKKGNINKLRENDANNKIQNQKLKDIIEAIEIKKLQNKRPIIIQKDINKENQSSNRGDK